MTHTQDRYPCMKPNTDRACARISRSSPLLCWAHDVLPGVSQDGTQHSRQIEMHPESASVMMEPNTQTMHNKPHECEADLSCPGCPAPAGGSSATATIGFACLLCPDTRLALAAAPSGCASAALRLHAPAVALPLDCPSTQCAAGAGSAKSCACQWSCAAVVSGGDASHRMQTRNLCEAAASTAAACRRAVAGMAGSAMTPSLCSTGLLLQLLPAILPVMKAINTSAWHVAFAAGLVVPVPAGCTARSTARGAAHALLCVTGAARTVQPPFGCSAAGSEACAGS